jgi:Methyltransferase domain
VAPDWIDPVAGLGRALAWGARVADVGCGEGGLLIELALAFPASTFHGFDARVGSIHTARARAAEAEVSARVTFEVAAPGELRGSGYDLVRAAPADTRSDARIAKALAAGGVWLVRPWPAEPTDRSARVSFPPCGSWCWGRGSAGSR